MVEAEIPVHFLRENLELVGNSIFWRKAGRKRKLGVPAGTISNGYRYIKLRAPSGSIFNVAAHRISLAMHFGRWPQKSLYVDHIDGDIENNSPENLREVSNSINQRNRVMQCNNKSGVNGVFWHKKCQKWAVAIRENGKQRHVGTFLSLDEAKLAREAAEFGKGFTDRHGKPRKFSRAKELNP